MDRLKNIPDTAPLLIRSSSSSSLQDSVAEKSVNTPTADEPHHVTVTAGSRTGDQQKIKVYKWRWVVLAILVATLSVNNGVWISLSPIADVVQCYYNTSKFWVNSASMIYMVTYILFVVPCSWLLGKFGLRTSLIISAAASAVGSCLKVVGAGPSDANFWIMLTGQTIASICNLFLWGTPSYVAGIWFPSSERGTAAAIVGALGPQLGVVSSYVIGPLLVHSDLTDTVCGTGNGVNATSDAELKIQWTNTIYYQMVYYSAIFAGLGIILFILALIAVPERPPTPPSQSQKLVQSSNNYNQPQTFFETLKSILKNYYFIMLLVTAAINLGAAGATVSLFNELIHPYFKNHDKDVAYIGVTAQVPAMITVFVIGPILSHTKAFYIMNVLVYVTGFLSIAAFLASLEFIHNFYILYPIVAVVGSSVTGFQAVAYEYAAEMTYPLQEGISGGLVNWVSQPVAVLMVIIGAKIVDVNGSKVPVAWTIAGLMGVGAIITIFVRPELRKTIIDKRKNRAIGNSR